jgi:hypothetical protein
MTKPVKPQKPYIKKVDNYVLNQCKTEALKIWKGLYELCTLDS